jgi:hypothetical protein
MEEIPRGETSIHVLSVIRGLPSEAEAVRRAVDATRPAIVAVSIGPEELEALRTYRGTSVEPENFEEEIYVAGLSAWEPPVKPPPCFSEAIRSAERRGARLEAIDMDEALYADAYVNCVSALELVFQGRLERRLQKKRFAARTPQDFVLEWDAEVNGSPGFRRLQKRREAHIASRLEDLASKGKTLAVIEVERAQGVLSALRS